MFSKHDETHKMNISTSKEKDSPAKQEGSVRKTNKASSSSPWLRLKDPRIVRVSRAFGGKDRHSKVCTIRGLRDRRVRLSVPTAIQLYDLQDRLGLNQPSKVVDWLLNAAKQEIDELPPLPITPMNFTLNHHHELNANSQSIKEGFKIGNWGDEAFWNSDLVSRAKLKQVERDTPKRTETGDQQKSNEGQLGQYDRGAHCSSSGLMAYGSFFHLDHPNFASSNSVEFESQSTVPLPPSALSLSSSSHIFTPQPYFTTQNLTASADDDPRGINQFQMFSSSTQDLFPNSMSTSNPYSINDQSSGSSRGLHFNIN